MVFCSLNLFLLLVNIFLGVYKCDLWLQSHRKSLVFKKTDVRCLLLCMISCSSIDDVRINRQGFEKRVVSQDLQLWLSNVSDFFFLFGQRLSDMSSLKYSESIQV